jgi:hypothetical protein
MDTKSLGSAVCAFNHPVTLLQRGTNMISLNFFQSLERNR